MAKATKRVKPNAAKLVLGKLERQILSIEKSLERVKKDYAKLAGSQPGSGTVTIRIVDSQATGYVRIHKDDESKEIFLGKTSRVAFSNESSQDATLLLPIGPFKKMHEEFIPAAESATFTLNKKLQAGGGDCSYTFDYAVLPSGDGGGPNIIVRP
jgi:hypothetical protein